MFHQSMMVGARQEQGREKGHDQDDQRGRQQADGKPGIVEEDEEGLSEYLPELPVQPRLDGEKILTANTHATVTQKRRAIARGPARLFIPP